LGTREEKNKQEAKGTRELGKRELDKRELGKQGSLDTKARKEQNTK
jgi:hypothetical protein